MKLRDTTNDRNGDDLYHLLSIVIVVFVSLLAWGVQSYRDSQIRRVEIVELLDILYDVDIHVSVVSIAQKRPHIISINKKQNDVSFHLSINSVDSVTLKSLPIFGPVLTSRTIKFRSALGGFVSVDQLEEVYGIDSASFQMIKDWFYVDSTLIDQICIDTAGFKTLLSHPYLDYKTTKQIYRCKKHNTINNVDFIKNQPYIGDSLWMKIEPYLKICSIH